MPSLTYHGSLLSAQLAKSTLGIIAEVLEGVHGVLLLPRQLLIIHHLQVLLDVVEGLQIPPSQVEGVLDVDDVLAAEGLIRQQILPIFRLNIQLLQGLQQSLPLISI